MQGHFNRLDVLADEKPTRVGDDESSRELAAADETAAEHDAHCGGLGLYPACAQRFASRHAFVVFYCLNNVFQSMVFTYLAGVQASMERHFHFNSRQTGLLPSIGELGPLLSGVVLSYLASRGNRPRWMGVGMAFVTAGLVLGFTTYLMFDYPRVRDNTPASRRLCSTDVGRQVAVETGNRSDVVAVATGDRSGVDVQCTVDAASGNIAYFIWSLVYILLAIGSQSIYVISAPYMDDGVSQRDSPFFFALAGAARVLGPVLGYMLASASISVYVDPSVDPGITRSDQRWVGAWWIGLLVIAAVLTLYGFLISLFPRRLPASHLSPTEQKLARLQATSSPSRRDFATRMLRLLKNPVLMGCIVSSFFSLIAIIGFYTYQPKYMEHHFRIDKAEAAIYAGISKVTLVFGILGSGVLLRRFRPSGRRVCAVIVVVRVVGALIFPVNMLVSCGFGTDLPGELGPNGLDVLSACSGECSCTTEEYIPVCHRVDDQQWRSYFSPCHAGCDMVLNTSQPVSYTNCSCVDDVDAVLTDGLCMGGCSTPFVWYLVIVAASSFLTSTTAIPHFMMTLRCVPLEDKALALGLAGTLTAVAFGAGPLITGNLVDHTCLVWEESCGQTGACWVYDTDLLRYSIMGFYTAFALLAALVDIFVFVKAKNLQLYSDEEGPAVTDTEMEKKESTT